MNEICSRLGDIVEIALGEYFGPCEIFLGDTKQATCLTISIISYIIYKCWLTVKEENTKPTWKRFLNLSKLT